MKIVQINATCSSGSTGKIAQSVSRLLSCEKIENYILYSHGAEGDDNTLRFMNEKEGKVQDRKSVV